ncbi:MAG: UDP-N-acetylmuramoyl-L-alanyl-D-glutamate--2,6-diaminopimelate ligase [Propionibacteriaceae bacterium]|nr:UDP-N-acetylmuramoyl-L-alanyl-D-glutamate--2,6-diaminopimelate ligase [Propionibacteriaceae bacterium]
MKLAELIDGLPITVAQGSTHDIRDIEVTRIGFDSRVTQPGDLFVALPGANDASLDGHDFVASAYDLGARVFLCRFVPAALVAHPDAVVLISEDNQVAIAALAAKWYGYPARQLKFVAITGTKGKTTISFMLQAILQDAGKSVGLIGSNGIYYDDVWIKLLNTTPEPVKLHETLRNMVDAGVEYCIIEATSQGFMMHRTDGIEFDLGVYTNISPDHISATEHPSFEHYFACKQRIFDSAPVVYVNADDPAFDEIVAGAKAEVRTFGFGGDVTYRADNVHSALKGTRMSVEFDCVAPSWRAPMRVSFPGQFNASNALAAISVADYFDIPVPAIQSGLARAVVKGRMEAVEVPADFTVLIDFAHNRLSMESMMATAREYQPKRILIVFGLEGNRAHIRRFDSGEVLGRDADYVILSDASPRTDDADAIIADIATGIERAGGAGKYEIIRDRHVSIPRILDMAQPGDLVLLVGKGNVPYEEVNGILTPFDERQVVAEYFAR